MALQSVWYLVYCCRAVNNGRLSTRTRSRQRRTGIGQRILTILVEIVETRLRLAVVELEEEKANLIQILLMLGLTMLFAAFGLMSLMVLIIWAIDPQYRLNAMIATTVVLLLLALIGGLWTLSKARKTTLLRHTRNELANDRQALEDDA